MMGRGFLRAWLLGSVSYPALTWALLPQALVTRIGNLWMREPWGSGTGRRR